MLVRRLLRVVGTEGRLGQCLVRWSCFRSQRSFVYSQLAQDEDDNDEVSFVTDTAALGNPYQPFQPNNFFDVDDDEDDEPLFKR